MTEQEFNAMILPHHRRMYAAAMVIVGEEDEARDVVQDAFVRLWQRRDEVAGLANPMAYCMTVVKNLSLDVVRHRNLHPKTAADDISLGGDDRDRRRSEANEEIERLRELMEALPENQRRVIELSAWGGLDNEDISKMTGMSNVNVRAALSRGRKRLRALWGR